MARRGALAMYPASSAPQLAVHPSGHDQQARAADDHDTYAKAQDCAHFQPEGQ